MDSDEFVLLIVLAVVGGLWAFRLGSRCAQVVGFRQTRRAPRVYATVAGSCLAVLWIGLATLSAREVRADIGLQALFVAGGLVAIACATLGLSALGIDAVGDAAERDNPAALLAVCGLWIAVTICTMASNLGEGDFVGTTFIPLALCVASLIALAAVYSAATRMFAAVTVERAASAGIRFAGFAIAASIPLARAAAGDWVSFSATVRDFVVGTPISIAVLVLAIALQKRAERSEDSAKAATWLHGIPSAFFVISIAAAGTWVTYR